MSHNDYVMIIKPYLPPQAFLPAPGKLFRILLYLGIIKIALDLIGKEKLKNH